MKTFVGTEMKTIIRIFGLTLVLALTAVFGIPSAKAETGYLYVYNKDCADNAQFHIYSDSDDSCSNIEDRVISGKEAIQVKRTIKFDGEDINGVSYSYNVDCIYAVEAVGEIAGGFNYSADVDEEETITCEMKGTLFWKQCRCN